ncbi:MAG: adenosylmethionine decarboxylase [Desulfohalobiaceae bacterium]
MVVGRHIIAELYGVAPNLIAYEEQVKKILEDISERVGFTKVGSMYKQFSPWGVTGVILIEESHISIHTWPEYEQVNFDVFTCGDLSQADTAFHCSLEEFSPKFYRHYTLDRG